MASTVQMQSRDSKRRRFAPNMLPVIAQPDDTSFEHMNDSPLLLQLRDQLPSQQEIEAQLLQVGMRVRKSVNEGYQNSGRRAFTPRPFFNSHRLSPDTLSALNGSQNENDANFSAGGLHNVGNLAMQPISTATFCGISLAAMAHISHSTPIEEQKLWSYSTASKRRQFDDDSDSDDSQEFMPRTPQLDFADAGVTFPRDYFNISSSHMDDVDATVQAQFTQPSAHNRKIAQPRSRLRTVPQEPVPVNNPFAQIAPPRSFGGHQRMRSCGMEAMDFGEALFLQPRQDVDMDCS